MKGALERILDAGYEDVKYLVDYSYDDALIGITTDNRAVYDFDKMIEWLMETEGFEHLDAIEWIEYNTIRSIPYMGDGAPIIINSLE